MLFGGPSFWIHAIGGLPPARPPLPGSLDVDVAIVGGGYTGLWTAWYLKQADPSLRVCILEAEVAGYGASGRNGGWAQGELAGSRERYARGPGGRDAVVRMVREMRATVDEMARVLDLEGIDCDWVKGGNLQYGVTRPQVARLRAHLADERAWGFTDDDWRWLEPGEARERIAVANTLGATFSPHCARVQPAKLAFGLAAAVERLGVPIYERTRVTEILPHLARTDRGDVRAPWIVRATEGYSARLPGLRRTVLPMNSSMIATEPLSEATWREIGWERRETMLEAAHAYVYLQRTEDGRIAIGGRGWPYMYGSRTDNAGETRASTAEQLRATLVRLFPQVGEARIDHAWSGVLGVPRDWAVSIGADRATGIAWAGCYVGEGVAATNLAGRILRDLIRGDATDLTTLPVVDRRAQGWEPEPLRWLAVHGMYVLYRRADAYELRTGRASRLARLADAVTGKPH